MKITHYFVIEELLKGHFKDSPISMIEVGVDEGAMEKHLLSKFNNISIIGIDKNFMPDTMQLAINSKGKFTYLNTSSEYALKSLFVSGMKFDFIYIDAGHEEKDVKQDIVNAMLLTKKGGIIGGHDYGENKWDVKKVVDSMFNDMVKTGPNLTWWVYV